ncbi:MAG: DUF2179 domain-containing protein [Gemmatimonadota bacterium]|nr:DUF2179 domain-containing protein [Gemmatimonadota bacterium]
MVQDLIIGPFGPLIIFCLRVTDVSMATVRVLLIVRNAKWLVPLIGFFEVSIWVFAVSAVVQNLASPLHVIGYAGGFATGNFVGMFLEERLALGLATVHTMVRHGGAEVAAALRDAGFAVTEMDGRGRDGAVEVLYSVIPRRRVPPYLHTVENMAPDSFLVVDEPRAVRRGFMFPRRGR